MGMIRLLEMLLDFQQITVCYITEVSSLHNLERENLKSCLVYFNLKMLYEIYTYPR
jgi:hypothetical protein